jgi:hypothetical protein
LFADFFDVSGGFSHRNCLSTRVVSVGFFNCQLI